MAPIDYNERYMRAAKNDYKYLDHTAQGLPVLKLFQNKYGFLEVISKNNSGYIVGHHYDPATGQWVNGIYGFDRYTDATEYIFDNYVIRNVFDPSSPIDVRMEYAGKFNYNHTSQDYLSKHDHHSPDFDIYDHLSPFNEYGYNGGRKPSREEFEDYLTKYRKANQPTRSLNAKPKRTASKTENIGLLKDGQYFRDGNGNRYGLYETNNVFMVVSVKPGITVSEAVNYSFGDGRIIGYVPKNATATDVMKMIDAENQDGISKHRKANQPTRSLNTKSKKKVKPKAKPTKKKPSVKPKKKVRK